jgi:hypothetical protein
MSKKEKKIGGSWSKNSEDARILHTMLRNREINMSAKPRAVLETMGWIGKYKPESFRGGFNRMKEEIRDSATLVPRITGAGQGKTKC